MVQVSTLNRAIAVSCAVGLFVCLYAYTVERRKTEDPSYVAMCDLDEHMSCSRVLTSPYAKGFGVLRFFLDEHHPLNVPNSVPGLFLFALFAALCKVDSAWSAKVQVGLGVVSNIASLYLGGILFFVLKDFCVLCVTTYAINFLNLVLAYLRVRALTSKSTKQKGQQKSQKQQKKQQQQNEKQKTPQAEKKKVQSEKQKSPKVEKQKQQQQNGKVKNQEKQKQQQQQQNGKAKNQQNGKQSEKQKSPKTPNSKKKN